MSNKTNKVMLGCWGISGGFAKKKLDPTDYREIKVGPFKSKKILSALVIGEKFWSLLFSMKQ
jgi:hypothetical protein